MISSDSTSAEERRCSPTIQLRFPSVSYSTQVLFRVVYPLKQMTPSCRACRHSRLSSWLLRDGQCIPTRGPRTVPLSLLLGLMSTSLHRPHHPHACLPLLFLCSLPARALAAIPELDQDPRSQLCPRISLYSSGTRSGSTGLGKKCVNFWCRLDLVPSLGVPSLFNATK